MLLLIDAYNLLHLSDQLGRQRAEGWLSQARERLICTLAEHLGSELCSQTCLVFDSKDGPKDLPSEYVSRGIELLFAVNHDEADDLLEELIARHATPKRLMVVSSDHRIQKAAGRRGAKFMDADVWYSHLTERGPRLAIAWPPVSYDASGKLSAGDKPASSLTSDDVQGWLKEFSLESVDPQELLGGGPGTSQVHQDQTNQDQSKPPASPPIKKPATQSGKTQPQPARTKPNETSAKKASKKDLEKPEPGTRIDPELANPFPEGYGEDLLE